MLRWLFGVGCLISPTLLAQVAVTSPSDDAPPTEKKKSIIAEHVFYDVNWIIDIGAFYANVDSKVRIDGTNGEIGQEVDMESDLGLSEAELLFGGALSYHGWDRWSLGIEWFELNRSSSGSLSSTVPWGNVLIPVGADVDAYFNTEVFRLFAGYEIKTANRSVFGFGLGVHGARMDTGVDAVFDIGGSVTENFESRASTGAMLPLPNFGIWANRAYSERFLVGVRLDAFALDIDDYRGSVVSAGGFARYEVTERLSLGLGYAYFRLSATMRRSGWNGKGEFSYHGPKLFMFYAW